MERERARLRADGVGVKVPVGELLVDMGQETMDAFRTAIGAAGMMFANGPAGIFERSEREYGTRSIWHVMAEALCYIALGRADSIAAVNRYGLAGRFTYGCTAGGAKVEWLSGEPAPVVGALTGAAARCA